MKSNWSFEPMKCKGPQNASCVVVWRHVPLLPCQLARPHQVRAAQGGEQGVGAVAFFLQMTFNYVLMSCSRTLTYELLIYSISFKTDPPRPSAHLYDFLHTETLAEGHRVGEGGVNVVLWKKTSWYLFFISEDFLCFDRHLMSEMSCSLRHQEMPNEVLSVCLLITSI